MEIAWYKNQFGKSTMCSFGTTNLTKTCNICVVVVVKVIYIFHFCFQFSRDVFCYVKIWCASTWYVCAFCTPCSPFDLLRFNAFNTDAAAVWLVVCLFFVFKGLPNLILKLDFARENHCLRNLFANYGWTP